MARRVPSDTISSPSDMEANFSDANTHESESTDMSTDTVTESEGTYALTDTDTATESGESTEAAPPVEAPPAPVEVDLTPFKDAVTAAVSQGDETTGELPLAAIESVNAVYRELEGTKAKAQAREYVQSQVRETMNAGKMYEARSYWQVGDKLSAAGGRKDAVERVPADPTEAALQRVGVLQLALNSVVLPEGLPEDFAEKAQAYINENTEAVKTYLAWLQTPAPAEGEEAPVEPIASPVVKNAAKLALGRGASRLAAKVSPSGTVTPHDGPRRNILTHIQEAFADKPVGTFMGINDIVKFKSSEYGDDSPSSGAVSARFYPTADGKVWSQDKTPGFAPALGGADGKTRGIQKNA